MQAAMYWKGNSVSVSLRLTKIFRMGLALILYICSNLTWCIVSCSYVESEADCTLSLSLDPAYVKAYLRRGAARNALGKVESAVRGKKFEVF